MLERFHILTVTHKKADLNEIGDFIIKADDAGEQLRCLESLKQQFRLDELFYLSTCNRVLYFFVCDHPLDTFFAAHFLQKVNPDLPIGILENIEKKVYLFEGEQAVTHLFEVAASIDSLVVGERQIIGQLREAFEQCRAWGLIGDHIRLAIQQAIAAAKAVYSQTRIGDRPVSIVSLAIQKMLKANLPKAARILLIGAGQTNALVTKFLLKYQFTNVTVFNRSIEKAEKLSNRFNGSAHSLDKLDEFKGGFDCMIVCTGATDPIITPEVYEMLLAGEDGDKLVIDLAIPNNVAPEVVERFSPRYIQIEGLRELAKMNLASRELEVSDARKVLRTYQFEFPALLKQRQLEVALRRVPEEIKAIKSKALNEVFRKEMDSLDEESRELVSRMMAYMEKKCISIPMKAAREAIL